MWLADSLRALSESGAGTASIVRYQQSVPGTAQSLEKRHKEPRFTAKPVHVESNRLEKIGDSEQLQRFTGNPA
ncbi:MAG: hypothetical protein Fues2KO_48600 [Fuerstiella sp.]